VSNSKREPLPSKPHDDFPLFPHKCGQWAKKIKGHLIYFGSVKADPDGVKALAKYHDRIAGRTAIAEGLTVGELCNRFLTLKQQQVASGELVPRTFTNYKAATDLLVQHFGKHRVVDTLTVADFEALRATVAKGRGPVAIGNFVQICRIAFRYAYEAQLIDRPVRYGPTFKRPSKKVLRVARAAKGLMMFERAELVKLLAGADVQMRAMILLGVNCGFGNADIGQLPIAAIDFATGWLRFPRPKTGIDRRCPLWPETLAALRLAIAERPQPKDAAHAGVLFITKYGQSWFKQTSDNPIANEFRKLLDSLGLHRPRLGFYSLRRTFETVGGDSRDQIATSYIMGHAEDANDMAAVYRQRIDDARLQAVVDHVHAWLYPPEVKPVKPKRKTAAKAK
jgi:integrase